MGTIQEALKELNETRRVKKPTEKINKSMNESVLDKVKAFKARLMAQRNEALEEEIEIVDDEKELTEDAARLSLENDLDKLEAEILGKNESVANTTLRRRIRKRNLEEDFDSSLPVQPLGEDVVKRYVEDLPTAAPGRPPKFFKLGYMKELTKDLASKFRGGRGSNGENRIRILKCIEYSSLYTGEDWRNTKTTKEADKILGDDRHTGERTGFSYDAEDTTVNKIGRYADGSLALQAYLADNCKQKTKYFISMNDGDLAEATKEEVAQYLTPAAANRVLNGSERVAAGYDIEAGAIYDKAINRFKLSQIYMIGNLGRSIM